MYVELNAEVARQRTLELRDQATAYRRVDRKRRTDRRGQRRTFGFSRKNPVGRSVSAA